MEGRILRAITKFLKTTLVGGLLFVLPFVLIVLLVREALRMAALFLEPIAGLIPARRVPGPVVAELLAGAVIVLLCFLTGLFVGTRPGRALNSRLERLVVGQAPWFAFVKSVVRALAGLETKRDISVALARIQEAWVFAFVVERHANGLFTVFVPSAPTLAAGTIYFMTEDRLRPLDVPVMSAVSCITGLGVGSAELLERVHFSEIRADANAKAGQSVDGEAHSP
jgi:uncharacterized membrane protein